MTDYVKEQISVFIDDELSAEECEFFVRRLQRDGESRRQLIRYQMIGAAIRGEHIVPEHGSLRTRLQDLLAERAPAQGRAAGRRSLMQWLGGAGIAASVAAVSVLGLRMGNVSEWANFDERLERVEPPGYVVPLQEPQSPLVAPASVQLTGLQYLMYHGGVASSLGRTIAHTNVVASQEDDVDSIEEEAEE